MRLHLPHLLCEFIFFSKPLEFEIVSETLCNSSRYVIHESFLDIKLIFS
jgi:hypothetical protein